ncbi:MAG: GNAT family N-acetyltransferase [Muribaculaceae bacterium]|nr:GNAT family N-acetyltransferase [Muribaculaceae bacterium]
MAERIIFPVDVELLEKELTPERLLRRTNKADNEIYVVDAFNSPNVMREIGRLREISFRLAGGGTGKRCDIDEFDTMPTPCQQLIVWDPREKMILGGYRFITGDKVTFNDDGIPHIATAHMFHFSDDFLTNYLPHTLELGRSFVRPEYQSTRLGVKALFTLDNLWDGLGALTVVDSNIKYLFGKVTMYPGYIQEGRDMILYFMKKHFPDPDGLVTPIHPLPVNIDYDKFDKIFVGTTFKEDFRILNGEVRKLGYNIPPLVSAYMSLSPTMNTFGTAINDEFGDVEESGILLTIDDIFEEKKLRHIQTYIDSELNE